MADNRGPENKPAKSTTISRLLLAGVENFEVSEEPAWTATMTSPGLSFESLDRDGNPKIQSLMLSSGVSRWYAFNVPYDEYGSTFMDWATLTDGIYAFLAATDITVSREMYDQKFNKKKFQGKVMLGHVSNSSVSNLTWLYLPGSKKPILEQINTVVTVSKTTRKPIALPDWYKERYNGRGSMDKPLRVIPHQRPTTTFVYKFKVAWSDTDNYNHTNFASYARFTVDAIHAALLDQEKRLGNTRPENEASLNGAPTISEDNSGSDALKGLTKDIVKNGLKNMKILYLHECLEGQELEAHVWQEPGNPCLVKCAIEGINHLDICHLTFDYFEDIL